MKSKSLGRIAELRDLAVPTIPKCFACQSEMKLVFEGRMIVECANSKCARFGKHLAIPLAEALYEKSQRIDSQQQIETASSE